jgi:hypothetical protein
MDWLCPVCKQRPPANGVRIGKDGIERCIYCGAELKREAGDVTRS